jgi:hypothetical protein
MELQCCVCGKIVEEKDADGYSLQVRKFDPKSPEMIWAHGPCLRKEIPVVGVEIPGTQGGK